MTFDQIEHREIARYGYKIRIVAHEGCANDWAAYAENSYTREHGNDWDLVLSSGDKLYQSDAARLFPEWADRLHWRP